MSPRGRMLLFAIGAVGLVASGAAAQTAQTTPATPKRAALHLGSTPWSPFTNEPGKPRYAIELVEAALRRLEISAETAIVPDGTLTPALLEGRFDGSPALWRDPEREAKLVYSKPYLENRLVLVARRGVRRVRARAPRARRQAHRARRRLRVRRRAAGAAGTHVRRPRPRSSRAWRRSWPATPTTC